MIDDEIRNYREQIGAIKTTPYDDENERLKALTKLNNDFIFYQGSFAKALSKCIQIDKQQIG
ncbi:MAG: hypothetical protein LUC34_05575 [Campylobacter sp.]|nr:hypothetical protein [Campylobacter sp.]